MKTVKNILAVVFLLIVLFRVSLSFGSQQQAELYAECGRIQNSCQSQCVHIELINQQNPKGVIACNPKNNRISQCKNICYTNYIRCRGGR
jgi:hypothetical protein